MVIETLQALAEPSRLQIVDLLVHEPLAVGIIAERLGIRQPQASKHLHALSAVGIVEVRPDAQRRIYALRAKPFQDLDHWLERFRQCFEEQYDRLDDVLRELQSSKTQKEKTSRVRRARRKKRG